MVKKKKIDTGLERAKLFLQDKPAYLKKSYDQFYYYYNSKYPSLDIPSEDHFKEARKELRKKIYPNKDKIWTSLNRTEPHLPDKLPSYKEMLENSQKLADYFKIDKAIDKKLAQTKGDLKEAKIIKMNPKFNGNRNTPGTYFVTGCAHI